MDFNEKLRATREDKEETQKAIAEKLKITRQQYQLYESGKRTMPIDILKEYCLHYNVSADYLLGLPKGLEWPR